MVIIKKILFRITIIFVLLILFLFTAILIFKSEHNEFLNATFFESRKYISTDGPYFLFKKDFIEKITVVQNNNKYIVNKDSIELDNIYTQKHNVSVFSYEKSIVGNFNIVLHKKNEIPKSNYNRASKILAISDIEGNWFAFKKLLINSKVIDKDLNWIFEDGHLVLIGDFVDRGLNVNQILWLIYKLENDAIKFGGRVHFILGNHEVMNMDNRIYHVRSKYKLLADELGLNYSNDLLGHQSIMGKWLRSKNSIEKIGDYLFVHGGIGTKMYQQKFSLDYINNFIRKYNQTSNQISNSLVDDLILGKNGPLWYRGYSRNAYDSISNKIDDILNFYKIKKIIIGHSTVPKIAFFLENKIINIDVHFPFDSIDETIGECLLIKGDDFFVIDTNGKTRELNE